MLIFALEQKLKVHWNGLQKTFLLSYYTSKSEQAENSLVLPTLCLLLDFYFLEQLVTEPTRKQNILDLIFSNPALIDSICITETYLSDHSLLLANTCSCCCCDNPVHRAALLGHHYRYND